jgi:hypothetical protein
VTLVNWIRNLEQREGLKFKIGWIRTFFGVKILKPGA